MIDSIKYHIELEQYTYHVNSGIIKIQGNFLLLWRKSGGLWENSTGDISMSLTENHDSFLIKELDYNFRK